MKPDDPESAMQLIEQNDHWGCWYELDDLNDPTAIGLGFAVLDIGGERVLMEIDGGVIAYAAEYAAIDVPWTRVVCVENVAVNQLLEKAFGSEFGRWEVVDENTDVGRDRLFELKALAGYRVNKYGCFVLDASQDDRQEKVIPSISKNTNIEVDINVENKKLNTLSMNI